MKVFNFTSKFFHDLQYCLQTLIKTSKTSTENMLCTYIKTQAKTLPGSMPIKEDIIARNLTKNIAPHRTE